MDFSGAKLVCLIGGKLVTLLRDHNPLISYPNYWDMPGGGREGDESPEACLLRELEEELGLRLSTADLSWKARFDSPTVPGRQAWWFAATLPARVADEIVLGDEGQGWALMPPEDWLAHPRAIPHFKPRVEAGLAALGKG